MADSLTGNQTADSFKLPPVAVMEVFESMKPIEAADLSSLQPWTTTFDFLDSFVSCFF